MKWYRKDNDTIVNKYEFASYRSDKQRKNLYQDNNQILLRNYISKYTPYDSVLLYHQLGTGKTCSSISIAEGFKEYIQNLNRKIIVLVKNKNIQRNFMNELLSICTGDEYVSDKEREEYFNINNKNEKLQNKIHRLINKSYNFITYGTFINNVMISRERFKNLDDNTNIIGNITDFNNSVVIVDEIHNMLNNDGYIALKTVLKKSYNYRLILLTATPMYDNPTQIFELSNLLNANNDNYTLPIRKDLYKNKFLVSEPSNGSLLKSGLVNITEYGSKKLSEALEGKVSYLKSNTKTNPRKIDMGLPVSQLKEGSVKLFYCIMSKEQYKTYLIALKNDKQFLSSIKNTSEKSSGIYKSSSDASTMTYPDNKYGEEGFKSIFNNVGNNWKIDEKFKNVITTDLKNFSSKLYNLLKNIKNGTGNTFVYSNYVSYGGTTLIKQILLNNGYTEWNGTKSKGLGNFILYDESNGVDRRENLRRIFNSPANKNGDLIKIIIGSPIIAEGITLKNVRSVHIIDPWWNMSKINQIIGRSVRNNSHIDLDLSDRNVKIYKYASIYNSDNTEKFYNFFIDKERYILSEEKDRSNKKIERLLKEISFSCNLFKTRNLDNDDTMLDGSPECDYTSCEFSCKNQTISNLGNDKSTYTINLDFFDKYDIDFVKSSIKDLFIKYFIWQLDDILNYFSQVDHNISHESIFFTLNNFVNNKTTLLDMYNREGFIIRLGEYYIFNPYDIDIKSSLYTKFFDFSVKNNKYTINEFSNIYLGLNLHKTEKQKKITQTEQIDQRDIDFNDSLLSNNEYDIIGTYRQKGVGDLYGVIDNKFRLIIKNNSDDFDKRKKITGMVITSFKKDKLLDFISSLNIDSSVSFEEYSNKDLANIIEKFLKDNNRILH